MPASSECTLHEIMFHDKDGFNKCGLWYAPLTISMTTDDRLYSQEDVYDMSIDFAILCPCISKYPSLKNCYTAITKEWNYRTNTGLHVPPEVSLNFFSTNPFKIITKSKKINQLSITADIYYFSTFYNR